MERATRCAVAFTLASGCLEYSPHAPPTDESERDLNRKALARLEATPPQAPLRFAVVGDTHRAFDDAEDAIERLNERDDLAFVVQLGDFTHIGIAPEFRRMNELFRRLRVPYLVVIGVHDHLGNGSDIYAQMFGPTELAFTYGGVRFVLFDSCSREREFDGSIPDLAWLGPALARDGAHELAVLLSHVAPGSSDFDPALAEPYLALLRASAPAVTFHAHEHEYRVEDAGGLTVYYADSVDHRSYLVVTISGSAALEVERIAF